MASSLRVKKVQPDRRSKDSIALRLNASDGAEFRRLAEKAGVGPSTFARAIIEQYVKDYGSPPRKKKKKKKT